MEGQKTGVNNKEFVMDQGKLYVKETTSSTNEPSGGFKKLENDINGSKKTKRELEGESRREHYRGASSRQLSCSDDTCEAVSYLCCGLLSAFESLGSCSCNCDF